MEFGPQRCHSRGSHPTHWGLVCQADVMAAVGRAGGSSVAAAPGNKLWGGAGTQDRHAGSHLCRNRHIHGDEKAGGGLELGGMGGLRGDG